MTLFANKVLNIIYSIYVSGYLHILINDFVKQLLLEL